MSQVQPHAIFVSEVADHVRRYCSDQLDRTGVNRLVTVAAQMARQRLSGRLRAAAHTHETTVDQQAISVVAPVFSAKGSDSHLADALSDGLASDNLTLFQRFQAVVVRVASQELFHRWDESDPLSAKLWRSIHQGLRQERRLVLIPQTKPLWVALAKEDDSNSDIVKLDIDEVPELKAISHESGAGLAGLVVEVLRRIKTESGNRLALSIDEFFDVLRKHRSESVLDQLGTSSKGSHDPHLRIAVDKATKVAGEFMEQKLERYRTNGKLPPRALEGFRLALSDILSDCADGGPAQSNYRYLEVHWPDLAWRDYRNTYRAKFEYLAESVQRRFSEVFREVYDS